MVWSGRCLGARSGRQLFQVIQRIRTGLHFQAQIDTASVGGPVASRRFRTVRHAGAASTYSKDDVMAGKHSLAAAVVVAATLATSFAVAAPGNAAPYVKAPTLSVSTTAPCKSTTLTATGTDFVPRSTVTLTLASTSVGSLVVSANGGFTTTVTVPEITGTFRLVAAGPRSPRNSNTAQATLTIRRCPVEVPVTG